MATQELPQATLPWRGRGTAPTATHLELGMMRGGVREGGLALQAVQQGCSQRRALGGVGAAPHLI